jgi:hypothetical protein
MVQKIFNSNFVLKWHKYIANVSVNAEGILLQQQSSFSQNFYNASHKATMTLYSLGIVHKNWTKMQTCWSEKTNKELIPKALRSSQTTKLGNQCLQDLHNGKSEDCMHLQEQSHIYQIRFAITWIRNQPVATTIYS